MREQIEKIVDDFIALLKKNYEEAGVRASGNLINNISSEITLDKNKYLITITLPEYYKYVELGRKPGKFPPLSAIREWIRVKPVIPRPLSSGKLPTTEQLAFLISRKIARDGILPRPVLSETSNSFDLTSKIFDVVSEDLCKQFRLVFSGFKEK